MTYDVFLSHSSKDKAVTDAVCHYLESQGIRCWVAPRDVRLGESYATQIVRAISASRAITLIFSDNANQSKAVQNELECAFSHGIPIFPLRVEDVPFSESLEFYLGATHWLDAFSPEERHFEQLTDALKRHFGQSNAHADRITNPLPTAPTPDSVSSSTLRPPTPVSEPIAPSPASPVNARPGTPGAPLKRAVRPATPHAAYLLAAVVSGVILTMLLVVGLGYWLLKDTQLAKGKSQEKAPAGTQTAVANAAPTRPPAVVAQAPVAATAAPTPQALPTVASAAPATTTPPPVTPAPNPTPLAESLPSDHGVFAVVSKKVVPLENDPTHQLSLSTTPEFIAYDPLIAASKRDWIVIGMAPDQETTNWAKQDSPTTTCRTEQIPGQPEMVRLQSPEPLPPGFYCLKGAGKEMYFGVELDQFEREVVRRANAALKDSIVTDEGLKAMRIAAASDEKDTRWRTALQALATPRVVPNHSGALLDLRFSPNGSQLLGRSDNVLSWKMPEAKPQTCVEANKKCQFSGITINGNGKLLIAGTLDNRTCLWDGATGAKICDLQDSKDVKNVRFASGTVVGDLLAPAKDKKPENTLVVRSWSTDGKLIGDHDVPNWTEGLRLQPLGPSGVLAYACRQVAHVLDVSAGKVIADVPSTLSLLAVGCKGEYLVQPDSGNTLELWEAGSTAARVTCQGMSKKPDAAAISPDSKLVVAVCTNEETCIWDASTGKQIGSYPGGGTVHFSDDSSLFARVLSDQVVIHNAQTGAILRSLATPRQSCFAFAPNLQWAASACGSEVRLWRLRGFANPGDIEGVVALTSADASNASDFETKVADAAPIKQVSSSEPKKGGKGPKPPPAPTPNAVQQILLQEGQRQLQQIMSR